MKMEMKIYLVYRVLRSLAMQVLCLVRARGGVYNPMTNPTIIDCFTLTSVGSNYPLVPINGRSFRGYIVSCYAYLVSLGHFFVHQSHTLPATQESSNDAPASCY